jgi:hypothetical protein
MRHAKELKILVWPLCNELGSVLRNFYEELVHILVKKSAFPYTHTTNKPRRTGGEIYTSFTLPVLMRSSSPKHI